MTKLAPIRDEQICLHRELIWLTSPATASKLGAGRYTSSMTEALVFRCETCGAPLAGVLAGAALETLLCSFCESENHPQLLDARGAADRAARVTAAAREARQLARDLAPRIAEVEARLNQAVIDGDDAAAIRAFEGLIRLHNASSYHILAAMDPGDPVRVDALAELDRGIAEAVATFAESRVVAGKS